MTVAFDPLGIGYGEKPIRSHNSQAIERKAHGFPHAHEPVDRSDLGQHMRGIGALPFSGLQPSSLLTHIQQRVEKQTLCVPFYQALAKFREHACIKAWI